MEEVVRTIRIIMSLTVNYPIIKALNYHFNRIPLLIVDSGQIMTLLDILNIYDYVDIFNYPLDKCRAKARILEGPENPVLFICCSEKQKSELADWIVPMYSSARLDGKSIRGLPIVVSDISYMEDSLNQFFTISLVDNDLSLVDIKLNEVKPDDKEIPHIIELQGYIKNLEVDNDVKILCSAASFFLKKTDNIDILKKDISFIKNLFQSDEDYHDISDISQKFLYGLQKWQKSITIPQICDLANTELVASMQSEDTIFYSEEYVYISEGLLKKISAEVLGDTGINTLKQGLLQNGFLAVNNSSVRNYTVKMYYFTEMGQQMGIRKYRFYRNKLAPVGEDFIENFEYI